MFRKKQRHVMQKWIVPRRDEQGQWWWNYQKVTIVVLPEEEKLKFIEKMTSREKNVQKQ